jgi:hypothetical protein
MPNPIAASWQFLSPRIVTKNFKAIAPARLLDTLWDSKVRDGAKRKGRAKALKSPELNRFIIPAIERSQEKLSDCSNLQQMLASKFHRLKIRRASSECEVGIVQCDRFDAKFTNAVF